MTDLPRGARRDFHCVFQGFCIIFRPRGGDVAVFPENVALAQRFRPVVKSGNPGRSREIPGEFLELREIQRSDSALFSKGNATFARNSGGAFWLCFTRVFATFFRNVTRSHGF